MSTPQNRSTGGPTQVEEEKKDWRKIAKDKRAEREARLPSKWLLGPDSIPSDDVLDVTNLYVERGWLSEAEMYITNSSMVQVAGYIKEGKYTAVEVFKAFAHRATIAHQLVNPLSETNFDDALQQANKLDEQFKETGTVVGPLHGVPISVKDQFHVKGLDTTIGFCAWAGNFAKEDSTLIACLRKAGAIILTKTNVGQALKMYESVNLVFGRTLNPYNRTLTAGGSSGGESALLAMRGSAIGVCTDYGGSIRQPASNCGLYGLRPSWGRVSLKNTSGMFVGLETRRSTAGPLAQSPEDIELFMSGYMAQKPWEMDQDVLPMPWKKAEEVMPAGKLCFAVAWGDEEVTPHPPIVRGLMHVVEALERAGHIVVNWEGALRTKDILDVGEALTSTAGGEDIENAIKSTNEPIYPNVGDDLLVERGQDRKPISPYEVWQLHMKKQALCDWAHETWMATSSYSGTGRPIDGLIMPVNVCLATPHSAGMKEKILMPSWGYADVAAILDLTAAAFPTGLRQDPTVDTPVRSFQPRSELDKELQDAYGDPAQWTGAPIGLQIIGRRLEEEKVVAMLCKIKDALERQEDA